MRRAYAAYLLLGGLFGLLLSRGGATSFERLHGMFLFRDFQLFGVIGTAIPVAAAGFAVLRRLQSRGRLRPDLRLPRRRLTPGTVPGSVIFGLGWGLTGTCPGPALVQLGEGHGIALFTVAGILAGNWAFKRVRERWLAWEPDVCG